MLLQALFRLEAENSSQPEARASVAQGTEIDARRVVAINRVPAEEANQSFWSDYVGRSLAILLQHAGYHEESQRKHLRFFKDIIAPHLGAPLSSWKSFMTDDGNPVELSWEWSVDDQEPRVRYSIEPIGPHTGTKLDPFNTAVIRDFDQALARALPEADMTWYEHFARFFSCSTTDSISRESQGHATHRFYAFDLVDDDITAKAYFFPGFKARELRVAILDLISQSISSAPQWFSYGARALAAFQAFGAQKQLEYDMVAIDLVKPRESRIKIYYRCRETAFESVVDCLTLSGLVTFPALSQGIQDLRVFWNALFQKGDQSQIPLPTVNHRTAGILYNVELRPNYTSPVVKMYIPVRHYCNSDQHVVQTLSSFLRSKVSDRSAEAYTKVMQSLL
ncbi:MAG: hypothetical protein M1822_006245 [Bathelium mastoideum]|nr:MAG: hypothetical protein M1822_006245 [Bathelium mastoideum]